MSYLNSQKNFFGREKCLELLKRRVIDLKDGYRQNVAFLGNRYVGKSELLQKFISDLDEKDVTVIYLDLENKDFGYFFSKFTGSLLHNYSRNKNLPLHEDLNLLLESTRQKIPHTVDVIKKIKKDFSGGKLSATFLGLMTLPEVFTNETGEFCVLILDEFQSLDHFAIPNVFQDLGKKIMTQKKCLYIVSSSYQNTAKKILSEKLSLLFGNFEMINIEPFDCDTSRRFIESNLSDLRIGMELCNFLTDFTDGHPLYLNLICHELINLSSIHQQTEIYLPILSQAVERTIFDRWGVLSRHFELIMTDLCQAKGNNSIPALLISMSNGRHKHDEICTDLNIKKTQLTQKLNRLLKLGVVVKNGNFHYFKDRLFKYWIKYVYRKRIKAVELSPGKQSKQFKDEFNRSVDNFKIMTCKNFLSRVMDLLGCFDNEAFDLNGRKYRLPLFREIHPYQVSNEDGCLFDVIEATAGGARWCFVLKKDSFKENDIGFVLEKTKKNGKKPDRCLIISLNDLDGNARVKALQERFWIWNEEELSTLLTLFDKPYISA